MTLPTFVAVSSQRYDGSVTGATVTKPVGLAVGHVMLAAIGRRNFVGGVSPTSVPSGFIHLGNGGYGYELPYPSGGPVPENELDWYYKVADAADVAAVNFTWGWASASQAYGIIVAYANCDQTNPVLWRASGGHGGAGNWLAPQSPVELADCLAMYGFYWTGGATANGLTTPSGWTERYDVVGAGGGHFAIADKALTAGGDVGEEVFQVPSDGVSSTSTDSSLIVLRGANVTAPSRPWLLGGAHWSGGGRDSTDAPGGVQLMLPSALLRPNDVLLAHAFMYDVDTFETFPTPPGWTKLGEFWDNDKRMGSAAYGRLATASPPSNVVLPSSNTNPNGVTAGFWSVFAVRNAKMPTTVTQAQTADPGATTVSPAGVTVADNNSLLVGLWGVLENSPDQWGTAPAGMTLMSRVDYGGGLSNGTALNGEAAQALYIQAVNAGATGSRTFTRTQAEMQGAYLFALSPAGVAIGGVALAAGVGLQVGPSGISAGGYATL